MSTRIPNPRTSNPKTGTWRIAGAALTTLTAITFAATGPVSALTRDNAGPTLLDRQTSGGGTATCRDLPAYEVFAGETFHGTEDDDVILVHGDGAEVFGHGGDDLICAVAALDEGAHIHGGDGNDTVVADGSHVVYGNAGDDVLLLNGGQNEGWGGDGNDTINGAGSTVLLAYGDAGNDTINGSPGDDWLGGYAGNDLIMGWDGDDLIFGMDGDDELRGGNGFDEIGGSNGFDTCTDFAGPVDGASITGCENVMISLGGGIGGLTK